MFTRIKVKNFLSLKELDIDFRKNNSKINNFIAIYGENGIGKTNITELFMFLNLSVYNKTLQTENPIPKDFIDSRILRSMINYRISDFKFSNYRTIGIDDPTEIEYNFNIDGIPGTYYIKFLDKVIEEKLIFRVSRQNNYYFEIKKENDKDSNSINYKLNDKVFVNKDFKNALENQIERFWGKYSFLSIIDFEDRQSNSTYVKKAIIDNYFSFINLINNMSIIINDKYNIPEFINNYASSMIDFYSLSSGIIKNKESKNKLLKYEEALMIFFVQAYYDVKDVKYEFIEKEDYEEYKLYFYKKIGSKVVKVSIDDESYGTKKIVNQFRSLLKCLDGCIVVIDEIDNGIHDLLMKNIIESILPEITGQLIITTHNTELLEITPKENVYILSSDAYGEKKLYSINDFDFKVQKNNNLRNLYLKGLFGGVPMNDGIFFDEVSYALQNDEEEDKL